MYSDNRQKLTGAGRESGDVPDGEVRHGVVVAADNRRRVDHVRRVVRVVHVGQVLALPDRPAAGRHDDALRRVGRRGGRVLLQEEALGARHVDGGEPEVIRDVAEAPEEGRRALLGARRRQERCTNRDKAIRSDTGTCP